MLAMEEIDRDSISICKKGIRTTLGLSNQPTYIAATRASRELLFMIFRRALQIWTRAHAPAASLTVHRIEANFLELGRSVAKKDNKRGDWAQKAGKRVVVSANRTHVHDEMNLQNKDLCHG